MKAENQVDRTHDSLIVDLVVEIMGNGTFTAETINESLLFKMLERRGTPLTLNPEAKYCRDIEADWLRDGPAFMQTQEVA